jgi:CubicO group peptidase (beta-lactamase class C family)
LTAWTVVDAKRSPATGRLASVDAVIEQAIHDGNIPGAVLLVGHNGQVICRKAYGNRALEPRREPMTPETIFDLASLTKVVATTTAVMKLVEQGKIRLNDPVAKYLPEFGQNGKEDITVRQLLTHYSGLEPDLDLKTIWEGKETAYQMAFGEAPEAPPGSRFSYSDVNFIVLGALLERVSGETLDKYCERRIFAPLKMMHTRFTPPAALRRQIAPTQYDENEHMLRGVVHDPTARRMGGVAGHAGLFSTADDLAKFAQALLNGGGGVLSVLSVEKMTRPEQPPSAPVLRGFGWDIDSPFSSNRGDLLPVGSYGHTGFTGTSNYTDLHHSADQCGSSARQGKCDRIALKSSDRCCSSTAADCERKRSTSLGEYHRLQRGPERRAPYERTQWERQDWNRCAGRAWLRCTAGGRPQEADWGTDQPNRGGCRRAADY